MDRTERLLCVLLGEVYRVQRHLKMPCSASTDTIYGLLSGIEPAIDSVLANDPVSENDFRAVCKLLFSIDSDPKKKEEFSGFYDLEDALRSAGLDRSKIAHVITYLNAGGKYTELIEKMDSSGSPTECRNFDLTEFDK